jgi:hypothetical protein
MSSSNRVTEEQYVSALKFYAENRVLYRPFDKKKVDEAKYRAGYTIKELIYDKLRNKCVYNPAKKNWHKFRENNDEDKALLAKQTPAVTAPPDTEAEITGANKQRFSKAPAQPPTRA